MTFLIVKVSTTMTASTMKQLLSVYPWIKLPLVVNAPMRLITGPSLALSVSNAGGLGFIGPGEDSQALMALLSAAKGMYSTSTYSSLRDLKNNVPTYFLLASALLSGAAISPLLKQQLRLIHPQQSGSLPRGMGSVIWRSGVKSSVLLPQEHRSGSKWAR
jgi:NAD(P)H-dependent flavin oxidoreductase YrpB (nitropropane dioxygenase family)